MGPGRINFHAKIFKFIFTHYNRATFKSSSGVTGTRDQSPEHQVTSLIHHLR